MWALPENRGGLHTEDYSISGSMWEPPYLGKLQYHVRLSRYTLHTSTTVITMVGSRPGRRVEQAEECACGLEMSHGTVLSLPPAGLSSILQGV